MKLNIEKIEKERQRLGLSNEDVANLLGITRQGWYDFISRPENKTLVGVAKVAKIFDLDPKDLLI